MKLHVLGSNAGAPAPTNPGSGYLVESGGARIWMDCGPGTFMELGRRVDPMDIDAVVLSHIHVDHSADVLALYAYLAYARDAATSIPVYAPAGAREQLAQFAGAHEEDDHLFHRVLRFEPAEPGSEAVVGDLTLRFGSAIHSVPALVVRFEGGGQSLTYSGDTGPGGDLIEMATMTDLLVCEASIQGLRTSDTYAHHLTAKEAGEIAAISGAGTLLLTHVPLSADPQLSIDQASGAFAGPIRYAAPGSTFTTE